MSEFNKQKFLLYKFTINFKKKNPFFLFSIKSKLIKKIIGKNFLTKKKIPLKVLNQILYRDLINENFNEKIFDCLLYKKKLIYPLPYDWCKIIDKKIKVNFLFCRIYFYKFIIKFFLKNFILNLLLIFKFKPKFSNKNINMFFDLSNGMDYHFYSKKDNFFKKFFKIIKKDLIIHDNQNLAKNHNKIKFHIMEFKNFHFINNNFFTKLKLFIILNYYSIISFIFLIFGRIERCILFDDFIKITFINENKLNKINLFFNNSTLVHRPLWTYSKYCHKISSYVYYYSSNVLALLITKKEEKIHSKKYTHFYNLLTWNKFLVASIEQHKLLEKYLDDYKYKLQEIGIVPFEGKKFNFIKNRKFKYLSLFEVTPFKLRRIVFHENPFWYYNYKNTKLFYEKIINYFKKNDKWIILVKRKRHGDSKINLNLNHSNVKLIDPSVSAIEMIKKSELVISMPYSTPSFFAREKNIPSFFFDSTGLLQKKHINNQRIPLLSNYSQINKFLIKNKINL